MKGSKGKRHHNLGKRAAHFYRAERDTDRPQESYFTATLYLISERKDNGGEIEGPLPTTSERCGERGGREEALLRVLLWFASEAALVRMTGSYPETIRPSHRGKEL